MSDPTPLPLAPDTLASAWESFVRLVLDPIDASQIQREETRRAFYGGATVMFEMVMTATKPEDEDVCIKNLNAIEEELTEFRIGLQTQIVANTLKHTHRKGKES